MIVTSGPVKYSEVKGLLHLDEWWWVDTGIKGCAFRLLPYGGEAVSYMDNDGRLHGAPGYLWDGTSRPVVRAQTKVDAGPSLMHDLAYEGARAGKIDGATARRFDALYIEMLRERGMGPIRCFFRRAGLFLFGWTARRRSKGPEYPHRAAR
jgi:hypothetical protein